MRQCLCCREKAEKRTLLRVAFEAEGFFLDFLQEAPGRAVYIHLSPRCLRDSLFQNALRRAVMKRQKEKERAKGFKVADTTEDNFESEDAMIVKIANLKTVFERGRHKISQMIESIGQQPILASDHGKKNKKCMRAKASIEHVERILDQAHKTNHASAGQQKKRIRL